MPGAVARERVVRRPRLRERALAVVVVGEGGAEMIDQRHVEAVEPDHHAIGFLAVVVPGPGRRDDEVAGVHVDALAVHGGVGALAFDDEAKRRLRMPVRRRDLAALDGLDRAGERVRRAVLERRIVEHQHAAVGFGRGDDLGGFEDVGPHVALVVPVHRRNLRRRLAHHDPVGDGPERRDVLFGHPRGERLGLIWAWVWVADMVSSRIAADAPTMAAV